MPVGVKIHLDRFFYRSICQNNLNATPFAYLPNKKEAPKQPHFYRG